MTIPLRAAPPTVCCDAGGMRLATHQMTPFVDTVHHPAMARRYGEALASYGSLPTRAADDAQMQPDSYEHGGASTAPARDINGRRMDSMDVLNHSDVSSKPDSSPVENTHTGSHVEATASSSNDPSTSLPNEVSTRSLNQASTSFSNDATASSRNETSTITPNHASPNHASPNHASPNRASFNRASATSYWDIDTSYFNDPSLQRHEAFEYYCQGYLRKRTTKTGRRNHP